MANKSYPASVVGTCSCLVFPLHIATISRRSLVDLSSEFYTHIPHDFGMSRPPVINSVQMLKTKLQMVESLADIEIATRLLASGGADLNPIDHHYSKLKCGIQPVEVSAGSPPAGFACLLVSHPAPLCSLVLLPALPSRTEEER